MIKKVLNYDSLKENNFQFVFQITQCNELTHTVEANINLI